MSRRSQIIGGKTEEEPKVKPKVAKKKVDVDKNSVKYAFDFFKREKKTFENVRVKTIKNYKMTVSMLVKYILEDNWNYPVVDIDQEILKRFIVYLKEVRGNSASSINAHIRNLNAFFNTLNKNGVVYGNPAKELKKQRVIQKPPVPFSKGDLEKMFGFWDKPTFIHFRNKLLLLLMLDTGARTNEICSMDIDHVKDGYVEIKHPKSGRMRNAYYEGTTGRMLKEYLKYRGIIEGEKALFINDKDKRITTNLVKKIFQRMKEKLDLSVNCNAHRMRHTFSNMSIESGKISVFHLQAMLGHSTLEMSKRYISFDTKSMKNLHTQISPVESLDFIK